jgi:hypothetical protein
LQGREVTFDDTHGLVGKILLIVLLETTQEEGTENLIETADDKKLLLLSKLHLVLTSSVGEWRIELLIERRGKLENGQENEVQHDP